MTTALYPEAARRERGGRPRLSGAYFNALNHGAILFDLDAARVDVADGARVGRVFNPDGSGPDMVQATSAKQPVMRTIGGPNVQPCLEFDGVDDYLASEAALDCSAEKDLTLFGVARNDTGGLAVMAELGENFNVNVDCFQYSAGGAAVYSYLKGDVGYSSCEGGPGMVAGTWYVHSMTLKMSAAVNEVSLWINGAATTTRLFNSNNSGNFGNRTLYVGSRGGLTFFLAGRLARMILYRGAMADAQRVVVEDLLMAKFAI